MRNITFMFIGLCIIALSACKNEPPKTETVVEDPMRNASPEELVHFAESALASNKYESLKQVCTGDFLDLVSTLAGASELEDTTAMPESVSEVERVTCTDNSDTTVTCKCLVMLDGLATAFEYKLVRRDGRWLIAISTPIKEPNKENKETSEPEGEEHYDQIIGDSPTKATITK